MYIFLCVEYALKDGAGTSLDDKFHGNSAGPCTSSDADLDTDLGTSSARPFPVPSDSDSDDFMVRL